MGNSQSKLKRLFNKLKVGKRTIKFLSVAPDLEVIRTVIKKAPNAVIGAILSERKTAAKAPFTSHRT